MHSYLRAIGFSTLKNRSEQNKLIAAVKNDFTSHQEISVGSDTRFIQINRIFDKNLGLSIVGELDQNDIFTLDHFFPYCIGSFTTSQGEIQIEAHSDKEAYSGVSDDYNLGITLIYFLQNISDYIKSSWSNEYYRLPKKVNFGALSIAGRILYGVRLDHIVNPYDKQPISNQDRMHLIEKARAGDLDALENLTLDDMDTYSMVSKRIKNEDLLTVVETYFIPFGINNEQYSILGIIQNIEQFTNAFSDEIVYNLTIACNDMIINVGINSLDLQGEPKIGRRFKGIIWLQGQVQFV